jgi:elongator complex protein 3
MNHPKKRRIFSPYNSEDSTRTKISNYGGVYPIPLYTKPYYCGGSCIYCPKSNHLPDSYIYNEDTSFALKVNYSPERQLDRHLRQIKDCQGYGLPLEIIILGGSFSSLTESYRNDYMSRLYNHLLQLHQENLVRGIPLEFLCSILTVESRPDHISEKECSYLRSIGVSKVEIGVQHVSDKVLKTINRGHSILEVIRATNLLKSHGFKVGYHVMLGLPGSTYQRDVKMLKEALWKPALSPDFLKIYACELLKNMEYQPKLWDLYNRNKWKIPTKNYIVSVLEKSINSVPAHVRISRIMRQFQNKDVIQSHSFGLHDKLSGKCRCIRCREIGKSAPDKSIADLGNYKICTKTAGREIYIEVKAHNNILLALARIYKIDKSKYMLREIHVYGKARNLGTPAYIQGRKIGSYLLKFIELFLLRRDAEIILINAAPGARKFFMKNGYVFHNDGYLKKMLLLSQLEKCPDKIYSYHPKEIQTIVL